MAKFMVFDYTIYQLVQSPKEDGISIHRKSYTFYFLFIRSFRMFQLILRIFSYLIYRF